MQSLASLWQLRYRGWLISLFACSALSSSGCGPISAHSAIARARIAIASTEKARMTLASTHKSKRADDLAIFEYHSALLYLDKAKREEGRASYQEAIDFANRSTEFANRARSQMLEDIRVRPRPSTQMRRLRMNIPPKPSQVTPAVTPAPVSPTAPAPSPSTPTAPTSPPAAPSSSAPTPR